MSASSDPSESDTPAAVRAFVDELWGPLGRLADDDEDLFGTLGIEGDDASKFMDAFAERFEVDGANYLWYFHHGEEDWSLGALFFKPIYRRVARIPITLAILTEAASTRRCRWSIRPIMCRAVDGTS